VDDKEVRDVSTTTTIITIIIIIIIIIWALHTYFEKF
jgi:hypothetical protein